MLFEVTIVIKCILFDVTPSKNKSVTSNTPEEGLGSEERKRQEEELPDKIQPGGHGGCHQGGACPNADPERRF